MPDIQTSVSFFTTHFDKTKGMKWLMKYTKKVKTHLLDENQQDLKENSMSDIATANKLETSIG